MQASPTLADQVLKGKLTLALAERDLHQQARLQARTVAATAAPDGSGALTGDFRIVGRKIDSESVDLILTDPPYDGESVELYRELGSFAARVLRPGGLCLAYHDWQQAESEASVLIERLCPAGGLVVDPMCGSGATLVAAKRLGRRWFGIEIDRGVAAQARQRVASGPRTLKPRGRW